MSFWNDIKGGIKGGIVGGAGGAALSVGGMALIGFLAFGPVGAFIGGIAGLGVAPLVSGVGSLLGGLFGFLKDDDSERSGGGGGGGNNGGGQDNGPQPGFLERAMGFITTSMVVGGGVTAGAQGWSEYRKTGAGPRTGALGLGAGVLDGLAGMVNGLVASVGAKVTGTYNVPGGGQPPAGAAPSPEELAMQEKFAANREQLNASAEKYQPDQKDISFINQHLAAHKDDPAIKLPQALAITEAALKYDFATAEALETLRNANYDVGKLTPGAGGVAPQQRGGGVEVP